MSAPGISERGAGLPRLTGLRWYAALLVFLYHVGTFVPIRLLRLFNFGTVGVTFFFVLSGFVLTWSTRPDLPASTFYRRRFARIYPSYIVIFLVTVAVIAICPQIGLSRGWLGIVATILMLQAWFPMTNYPVFSYNAPEWSLSCEAFFYASFPLVQRLMRSLKPRRQDAAVLGCVLAAVVASALLIRSHYSVVYTNPMIRLPEFMVGMWLALKVEQGWRPRVPFWVAVVIAGIAYELARRVGVDVLAGHGDYVMLLPLGLLVLAAAVADLEGTTGVLTRPVSIYLGEVSFAFYLVQIPVMALLAHVRSWNPSWSETHSVVFVLVAFVASLGAAALLHHTVELPLQRKLRGPGARSIATVDPQQFAPADEPRPMSPDQGVVVEAEREPSAPDGP